MTVKLLTEHHLEFLSLKRGCTGSSESTLVKMPLCWKSHVKAQIMLYFRGAVTVSVYGHGITRSKHEIDSSDVANVEASRKSFEPRHVISNNVAF